MFKVLNANKLSFHIEKYEKYWRTQPVKKKEMLLEAGEIANKVFYIESGIARIFFYNKKTKKETTFAFLSAGNTVLGFQNFLKDYKFNIPTTFNIQMISDGVVRSTSIETWIKLEQQDQELVEFRNQLILKIFGEIVQHSSNLATLDATAHYRLLLKEFDFVKDLDNEYVASYLGIDIDHFIRIKKKIQEKQ